MTSSNSHPFADRLGLHQPSQIMARALAACRSHAIGVFTFSALLNLLVLVPMLYMLQVYDRVVPTRGAETLALITLVLLLGLGTTALLDLFRNRLMVRASLRLDRQLAAAALQAGISQPAGLPEGLARQGMREFDILRQALAGPPLLALADIPWSPFFILICFLLNPLIGGMVLIGAIMLAIVSVLNQRATSERLKEANEAAALSYANQEQLMLQAETVRALGMKRAIIERNIEQRRSMLALQTEAGFAGGRYVTISKFIRMSLQSLALGLGAWLAINDKISGGAIFASSFLAGRALQPIDQMLASWATITRAREAYGRLNQLFGASTPNTALTALPDPQGRMSIEQVAVARPDRQGTILSGISFEVLPGEVMAIAGPSGAGKSTLVRTMVGAIVPEYGKVRIDGAAMSDWDADRLGSFIGYVPQEPTLFAGTIKENIARFEKGPDVDRKAIEAAKLAGSHELILRLPGGYDTMLAIGGRGLSAGQAQRIAITRALYGNPPAVLLDEPNAHLDASGEAQLVNTIAQLKANGCAVVIVAHRAGILGVVDRILVLKDGKIDAIGPRDQILAQMGGKRGPTPVPINQARKQS